MLRFLKFHMLKLKQLIDKAGSGLCGPRFFKLVQCVSREQKDRNNDENIDAPNNLQDKAGGEF